MCCGVRCYLFARLLMHGIKDNFWRRKMKKKKRREKKPSSEKFTRWLVRNIQNICMWSKVKHLSLLASCFEKLCFFVSWFGKEFILVMLAQKKKTALKQHPYLRLKLISPDMFYRFRKKKQKNKQTWKCNRLLVLSFFFSFSRYQTHIQSRHIYLTNGLNLI